MNSTDCRQSCNICVCSGLLPYPGYIAEVHGNLIYPIVMTIAVTGQILTLMVLNSPGLRSKTTYFLCSMAFADLCFFLLMFPINLGKSSARNSETFVDIFAHIYNPFFPLANWFSAASLWSTVAVTIERTIVVVCPFRAKLLRKVHIIASLVGIYLLTFAFNYFQFVYQTVVDAPFCQLHPNMPNNSGNLFSCIPSNRSTYQMKFPKDGTLQYVKMSTVLSIFCMVLFPLLIVICCNCVLIYTLHTHRIALNARNATNALLLKSAASGSTNSILSASRTTNERKITVMVVVIIMSFIVSNMPSAAIYLADYSVNFQLVRRWPPFRILSEASNILIELGKSANFFLYCITSEQFRCRLKEMLFECKCSESALLSKSRYAASRSTHSGLFESSTLVDKMCSNKPKIAIKDADIKAKTQLLHSKDTE